MVTLLRRLQLKLVLVSVFSFLYLLNVVQAGNISVHASAASSSTTTVTINRSKALMTSQFAIGATHEHNDADSWNNADAVASAKQSMQSSLLFQNQQTMGWGVGDPEPSAGQYNWSDLDARVQLMRDTHAKMVLTLCAAPAWMRPDGYQNSDMNTPQDLEIAPDSSHVQDFADLAAKIALRYPDVKYFQVWNELKGMYSDSPGATAGIGDRWDYERYTTLYNAVYDAVKQARPDALLGGPYVVMASYGDRSNASNAGPSYNWGTLDQKPLDVISYWLANKHGADFLTLDGDIGNDDNVWKVNEFATAQKFIDIAHWLRQQPNGGATLPIWWAEWYADFPANAPKTLDYYNALQTSDEIYIARSGAAVTLLWQPQGDSQGFSYREGIFTDTSNADGGQATKYALSSAAFKNSFGPGTQLLQTTVSNSKITVLASSSTMMLVNQTGSTQKVSVDGKSLKLSAYQVLITPTV